MSCRVCGKQQLSLKKKGGKQGLLNNSTRLMLFNERGKHYTMSAYVK